MAEYLEHARLAICHYPMAISQSVSISVGWGRFHQENIEQSIRSVDKALYRAKANGKSNPNGLFVERVLMTFK
ncbi:diguanylate cyclase domain-containing protein [Vibrio olivae]